MVRELDLGLALTRFQINGKGNSEMVSLLAGRDLNMAVEVANQGKNEYTGTVTYYQSDDDEITTNDNSLDSTNVSLLIGGGSWEATFTPTAPINVGTYYYGACLSFENEGNTNQVTCTAAIQVKIRGLLENVFNIDDSSNNNLELDGANSVTTTEVGGTTYLFTAGLEDDGVSVFSVGPDGSLINVANLSNDIDLKLYVATLVTTAEVGGTTYLFVAGFNDDGISVFMVYPIEGSSIINLLNSNNNVDDSDNINLKLDGARSVTTAQVGEITYLFVAGQLDHGVSVFTVDPNDGRLNNVFNVSDNLNLELEGAFSVITTQVGGTTYLFVAGSIDDGVSVFSVANDGSLINVANVADSDDSSLELDGASSVTTAEVGETTYLFVAGNADNGVSVFSVANDGTLSNVANVADDIDLNLDGVTSVTTAQVGGTTYLFVTGYHDDGVSVFKVNE